jgi:hypothetical protein
MPRPKFGQVGSFFLLSLGFFLAFIPVEAKIETGMTTTI